MTSQTFILAHDQARQGAVRAVQQAEAGKVVKITDARRGEDQSARFHAMCGDVAKQAKWCGRKLTLAQWKVLFISGHSVVTGAGADVVPGLENEYVNIREATSQMGVKRMASLIEYVSAWGANNGVEFKEPAVQGWEQ